jgi:hypothetical protein
MGMDGVARPGWAKPRFLLKPTFPLAADAALLGAAALAHIGILH